MRILLLISILLSACASKNSYEKEEIKVFNDILEDVLKKRGPSNLLPMDEWVGNPETGEFDSIRTIKYRESQTKYFYSFNHLLTINDTLKSLLEILKKDHWIIEEPTYDSITSNYLALETAAKKGNLKDRVINLREIENIWIYQHIGDTANLDSMPRTNINLKLSRVSFDKEMKVGMFYCSVLDDSQTGYGTLILVKKQVDKWVMIHGMNYD